MNFNKINTEKQQIVLNAILKCFSKNGYEKTSMSDIAKEAKISKASLFQYFDNKKNCYLYTYNYLINYVTDKIANNYNNVSSDFFDRIILAQKVKLEIALQFPYFYEFATAAYFEQNNEIVDEIKDLNQKSYISSYNLLYKNLDTSKFKDSINHKQALEILVWVSEGYIKNNRINDVKLLQEDFNQYLKILKKTFYKEEFQ